jgi:TRAP-type C4-dicarboxylate transport system permease small subunit
METPSLPFRIILTRTKDAKMDAKRQKPQVKILTGLVNIFERIAVFSLFGISAVIFAQILLRNFLSIGFPWADELSRFLHITLIFLTVPILYRERIIFKIDIFIERLPAAMQTVAGAFTSLVCVAFCLIFLLSFAEFMSASWDVPTPALRMPNLFFFFSVGLGILLLLFASLEKFIYEIRRKTGE